MILFYKPNVIKQLRKLPLAERHKIIRKLEFLSSDPESGKQLKGELQGLRSLRAWPYRIIYEVKKGSIIIYSIAHRKEVYR
jgi:mRNA-degrading endonuclease RelE of RelBE toxin-antitoxin system